MKKINEKLKTIAIVFCVIYTAIGLLTQTIKVAWAFDEWDLKRILADVISSKIDANDYDFESAVKDVISSKIDANDYDFKSAVERVVENNCSVDDDSISCY